MVREEGTPTMAQDILVNCISASVAGAEYSGDSFKDKVENLPLQGF